MGQNKYTRPSDHDTVIVSVEKIDALQNTCDEIKVEVRGINKRVNRKVDYLHIAVAATLLTAVAAIWKYAGVALAAIVSIL